MRQWISQGKHEYLTITWGWNFCHYLQLTHCDVPSVSACTAMIVSQQTKEPSPLFRLLLVNSFASLYLIFVIILGVRLHSWDDEVVGACYHTMLLSASSSKHPLVDKIYLVITSFYMFFTLVLSTQRPTERLMKTLWSNQESESQQERIMVRLISLSLIATLPLSPKSWES